MTSLITEPQNGKKTDPATIFDLNDSYIFYTENREWKGVYLGRYLSEGGDWIIQFQNLDDNEKQEAQEIVAANVISWKKIPNP